MTLQLNVPAPDFKEFYGRNTEQMPLLIGECRIPLSVVGLMNTRLEVLSRGVPEQVKLAWWDNYFDTGDGAVRHSDGRLKIVHDAQYLKLLTQGTKLVNGAVPFSDDFYRGLDGQEFTSADVEKYFNKSLSESEARTNPGWVALARGDKSLLSAVVDATFSQAKERLGYIGNMMGICHNTVSSEGAAGCLWLVAGLHVSIKYGWADGVGLLDYGNGRLVGVAPEARASTGSIAQPSLDQVLGVVLPASDKYVASIGKAGFERDAREALEGLYK